MTKYKVLSTKKLSSSLVDLAKQNGIEIIEKEFISARPIITKEKADEIETFLSLGTKPLVFTSSNAVEAVLLHTKGKELNREIYCLSGRTMKTIAAHPELGSIIDTADDAKSLAQKLVGTCLHEVIFFCGDKRRDEFPDFLRSHQVIVYEVIVYETTLTPLSVNEQWEGILFFSPSAVESFFAVNQLTGQTVCFAIGHTTANTVARYTNNQIIVSESPTQEMILEEVSHYFKNKNTNERIKE